MTEGAAPELQCRACKVMGGTVVGDKEGAIYTEGLKHLIRRDVFDGERLELDPCVGPAQLRAYEREKGRPCPRVALDERNREALELAGVLLDEAGRHAFPAVLPIVCADMDENEQGVTVRRALSALRARDVMALRYPKRKDGKR